MKFYPTLYSKVEPRSGAFQIEIPNGDIIFGYGSNLKRIFQCFCLSLINEEYHEGWRWLKEISPALDRFIEVDQPRSKVVFAKIHYFVCYKNLQSIRREVNDTNYLRENDYKILMIDKSTQTFIYRKRHEDEERKETFLDKD